MRFRALSPLVVTTTVENEKGLEKYHYRPWDDGLSSAV